MIKTMDRMCPICDHTHGEVLRAQRFVLSAGHPLSAGYEVVCCGKCGFVYADTMVNQRDYDIFYAQYSKYEDNRTSTGGGEKPWDAERLQAVAKYLSQFLPKKAARILDIGCANGGLLKVLKDAGYSNLCGIDPSPVCVQNTRAWHGIEAYAGALLSLPIELGRFDCVILSHVLEHVQSLNPALQQLEALIEPGGIVYIEVPNASQYATFVTSPFQDFNTEHINHFSLRSLITLLELTGWSVRDQGQKTIYASRDAPYPAIYVMCTRDTHPHDNFVLKRDTELRADILDYIQRSQVLMDRLDSKLEQVLKTSPEIIVWGTGQLTLKLLAETILGKANIAAFVDSNPINQGKVLRGVSIAAPENIRGMSYPIVVSALLHEREIAEQIQRMGLANQIILLG